MPTARAIRSGSRRRNGSAASARGIIRCTCSRTSPPRGCTASTDHGVVSRESKIAGREPITINQADAASRGIAAGDIVRVFNDRGAFLAGAVLSAEIRAGVVQIATGAWYDPVEPGIPGTLDKHGNPNLVTQDVPSSSLAGGCAAQSALVQIERYEGTLPEITAFDPPRFIPA